MLTKADTVKKLPQLTIPAASRTPQGSIKNFSVKELGSLNGAINRPGGEKSPLPLMITEPSPDSISESVRGRKIRDENFQQVSPTQPLGNIASY